MDNSTEFNVRVEALTFSTADYSIFALLLLISLLIGVYFGCYRKQATPVQYLMGGKNMGVVPIAISLAASYTSAITILGMPTEIYNYGTQYLTSCLAAFLTTFITGKVFLPVFYELQLTSSFEYLSLRFNDNVRKTASFLCIVGYLMTTPLAMYAPAMAFNLVTGIDVMYITPIVGLICIFYTTIGGLKAVVWTDTVQFIIMNGTILVVIILGIPNEGGLSNIWTAAKNSNRIQFINLDPSLYTRMTLWSMSIGMCVSWVSNMGVNQMCIQRFLSVSTLKNATKVLFIYCGLIVIIKAFCLFVGLIIYARYSGCDPLTIGAISKSDQILPYYILDTARNIPGLPGLFIAGIFSASLSTMSTILNTACGIIYKDFLKDRLRNRSEEAEANVLKLIVSIMGLICICLVFWIDKLGNIFELAISFDGTVSGVMLGMFAMGMLIPRANTTGTISGALISLTVVSFMMYGNKYMMSTGRIGYSKKSFSTAECDYRGNLTTDFNHTDKLDEEVFFMFRISFMWYSLIGLIVMMAVGIPVSLITEPPNESQLKIEYFSPVIKNFLPDYIVRNPKNKNHAKTSDESELNKLTAIIND